MHWAVVISALCVAVSGVLLWPSGQSFYKAQPFLPQALGSDGARVGLGVVQRGFKAGEAMHVKEGEQVYILKATFHDWYKVENVNGDVGVSTMLRK